MTFKIWRGPGGGRAGAAAVAVTSVSFVLSPLFSAGFRGFTPAQFPVLAERWPVQPAGWAFSIWGLIYLALLAGAALGWLRHAEDADWRPMRLPLALSLGLGTFWIALANRAPVLATALILFMAAFALAAFLRAPRAGAALWPAGLYAGWLVAASAVAVAVVLSGHGVLGAQASAYLALAVTLGLGARLIWLRPAPGFALALIWALFGITMANRAPLNLPVAALAGLGGLALAGLWLWRARAR